jgi:site-specific recombinase XerD
MRDVRHFLASLKRQNYASSTIKSYARLLNWFVEEGEFSRDSIQKYHVSLLSLSFATQRLYLTLLRHFLDDTQPKLSKFVVIPKVPKTCLRDVPEQDELRALLQKPDTTTYKGIRDRVLLELLYSTGIRREELVNLCVEDINLVNSVVRIQQGKMKKDRLVPMSKHTSQWVRRYISSVRPEFKPKTNSLFLSNRGQKMSVGTPNKIVSKYGGPSPHVYRHAYATHLLQNGLKETTLQRLLGHSQVSTTQVYTKVTILELKKSYERYFKRDSWKGVS